MYGHGKSHPGGEPGLNGVHLSIVGDLVTNDQLRRQGTHGNLYSFFLAKTGQHIRVHTRRKAAKFAPLVYDTHLSVPSAEPAGQRSCQIPQNSGLTAPWRRCHYDTGQPAYKERVQHPTGTASLLSGNTNVQGLHIPNGGHCAVFFHCRGGNAYPVAVGCGHKALHQCAHVRMYGIGAHRSKQCVKGGVRDSQRPGRAVIDQLTTIGKKASPTAQHNHQRPPTAHPQFRNFFLSLLRQRQQQIPQRLGQQPRRVVKIVHRSPRISFL